MKKYLEITNKYIKVQKKRTILTIMGIALASALIMTILTLYFSGIRSELNEIKKTEGDYYFRYYSVSGSLINKIKNNNNVEEIGVEKIVGTGLVSEISEKEKSYDKNAPDYRTLIINGVSDDNYNLIPLNLVEGRNPENDSEIVLTKTAINFIDEDMKIGDKFQIEMTEGIYDGNGKEFNTKYQTDYTLVGIIDNGTSISNNYILYGCTYNDYKNIKNDEFYSVYVKTYSADDIKEKANEIYKKLKIESIAKEYEFESSIEYHRDLLMYMFEDVNDNYNENIKKIFSLVFLLIILSTTAVIYNSFNISVMEKIRQFGILRCIGASPKQIKKIVLKEAFIIAGFGIPGGILLGLLVSQILIFSLNNFAEFLNLDIKLDFNIYAFLITFILSVITVYISAIGPMKQASKISPIEAVRNTGSIKKERIKKTKNIKKYRIIKKLFGIEGQLAYKNLKRNRKRYRITLFSMTISVVLYIVFIGLLDILSTTGYEMEENIGDFSVGLKDDSRFFSNEVLDKIKNIENIDSVYEFLTSESYTKEGSDLEIIDKENESIQILSFGDESFKDLKENLESGIIDKNNLNHDNGIILINTTKSNNSGQIRFEKNIEYKVGDILKVEYNGSLRKMKVNGIVDKGLFYGYSNNYKDIEGNCTFIAMTSREVFENIFGDNKVLNIIINSKDKEKNDEIVKNLDELFLIYPEYEYIDFSDVESTTFSLIIFLRIFLYGFAIIITIICVLNIINTISTNLILRTQEISIYKAIGMSYNGIKKMTFFEAIFYGLNSTIYGGLVSIGILSIIILTARKVIYIDEILPMIPFLKIFLTPVFAIAITIFAGYIPLKRINDCSIVENIRGEE
jgi:putative ABC transport system permease protein